MGDNIPITAGSGVNVRADDISSVYTQIVKLSSGADGVEDFLGSTTNPYPISLRDATTGSAAAIGPRVQTPTGNALQVQIGPGDVISNLPVTIDYAHHQDHEGEAYMLTWTTSGSATLNGTKDFRIQVADVAATTRTPHLVVEIISDATTTDLLMYEGTTWTTGSGGQDVSDQAYNRNRNVATACSTKIYVSGTPALSAATPGTLIWRGLLFTGARAGNTSDRALSEWILKTNTEYLLRITTSASGHVLVRISFYEDRGV